MVMVTGPNDDDDDDDAVTYRFWSVLCSMLLSTGLTACNMLEMKCDYAHPYSARGFWLCNITHHWLKRRGVAQEYIFSFSPSPSWLVTAASTWPVTLPTSSKYTRTNAWYNTPPSQLYIQQQQWQQKQYRTFRDSYLALLCLVQPVLALHHRSREEEKEMHKQLQLAQIAIHPSIKTQQFCIFTTQPTKCKSRRQFVKYFHVVKLLRPLCFFFSHDGRDESEEKYVKVGGKNTKKETKKQSQNDHYFYFIISLSIFNIIIILVVVVSLLTYRVITFQM